MFGIYKNTDLIWRRWFQAWFDILDYLVSILTFNYFYVDISGWLFYGEGYILGKNHISVTIRRRLKWSFQCGIKIAEELIIILTLGYLVFDWEQYILEKVEKDV